MDRKDWECIGMGGMGGVAPYVCQVMASFLPLLGRDTAALQARFNAVFPDAQTSLTLGLVIVPLFLIAAGVAYFNANRDSKSRGKDAFIAGIAVPGLILTFSQGLYAANPLSPPAPPATLLKSLPGSGGSLPSRLPTFGSDLRPSMVHPVRIEGDMIYAQRANQEIKVELEIQCKDCPTSINLSSLIRFVGVSQVARGQTPPAEPTVFKKLGEDPTGKMQSFYIEGERDSKEVVLTIPGHEHQSYPNPQMWRSGSSREVIVNPSRKIRFLIILRPGIFNSIRATFGRYGYYVIESVQGISEG